MQADAQTLSVPWTIGAIATEGSLGPLAERALSAARATEIFSSLADLYGGFLRRAQEMLPVGGRLVMTIPAFHAVGSDALFPQGLFRRALPASFVSDPLLSSPLVDRLGQHVLTQRGGIIVGSQDQFVRREVVRLVRI